jgi:hypothetical protein
MVGGARPANAATADDARKPLVPRRLFDQSRPHVELITAEFTAQLNLAAPGRHRWRPNDRRDQGRWLLGNSQPSMTVSGSRAAPAA